MNKILIALVVIMLIGGGIYYSKNKLSNPLTTTENDTSFGSEVIILKTYKNETYNFEFEIPDGFKIDKENVDEINISNGEDSFGVSVNSVVSFVGWDNYKSYGDVEYNGKRIGGIVSKVMNNEERVGAQLKESPYIFLAQLKPGDGNDYIITSSWLTKTQIDDVQLQKDFGDFVRSFKKI